MPRNDFVHLHVHTEYSLLDGACRLGELVTVARKKGFQALAITDHGNMFGAVEFHGKAEAAGLKPIIGMEAYVAEHSRLDRGRRKERNHHLVLLARNETGYRNLMKLSSAGYLEGFYRRPRIDHEIMEKYSEGLIALSACIMGEVSDSILSGKMDDAVKLAAWYKDVYGDGNFYLELQDHGMKEEVTANKGLLEISGKLDIPVIATNDVHFLEAEDYRAHDALLCVQTGAMLADTKRFRFSSDQFYLKNPAEMDSLFGHITGALSNTVKIAEMCDVKMSAGANLLPAFPIPDIFDTPEEFLTFKVMESFRVKYGEGTAEQRERIERELEIIRKTGYAGYFLIVSDFIDAARKMGVRVGPGRGSAVGSLVAYLLGITGLEPMQFDLLFERFLNPERVTMPDIDIDFPDDRRGEIIDYVIRTYGRDNVCQIITFGKMKARQVIKDVGRVMGMPYEELDKVAKLIPEEPKITIDKAVKRVPELKQYFDSSEQKRDLLAISRRLEGVARQASIHAAGVVITPHPVNEYVPLFRASGEDGSVTTTQYDMKCLEKLGVLKMDFLGLRTLTVIENTLALIRATGEEVPEMETIRLDDPETLDLFCRGDTIGVFQFESSGMREYLIKLKPDRFQDLIAMNALYRPGPMENIDDFIARKQGRMKAEYVDPSLEPILKETYGVIVYQEQVMRIASDLAGYSLGGADILRRAMGKKKIEIMQREEARFIEGCAARGINKKKATLIYSLIKKFAEYGFNKSHSTAYAYIAYQTAYLKVHFPAFFMAATLTSEMSKIKRVVTLLEEVRRMNIEILPPDVSRSDYGFTVENGAIRFGLGAVRNVGRSHVDAIVKLRKETKGFPEDFFSFCTAVDSGVLNRRVMEALVDSGAMDCFEGSRAQKLESIDKVFEAATRIARERITGQISLFGDEETAEEIFEFPEVAEDAEEKLLREKDALGFFLSGHPLEGFREEIQALCGANIAGIQAEPEGVEEKPCRLAGLVVDYSARRSKKGNMFASFRLEDMDGSIDAVIFSDRLGNAREFLSEGGFVVLEGTVSVKGESSKVFVNRVIDLKSAMATLVEGLRITLDMNGFKESGIDDLRRMISTNAGHIPVFIRAYDGTEPIVTLRIRKGSVRHEPGFLDDLRKIPGIKRAEWKVRPVSIGERVNGRNHYGKGKNSTLQT